jgi:hypothetical protein
MFPSSGSKVKQAILNLTSFCFSFLVSLGLMYRPAFEYGFPFVVCPGVCLLGIFVPQLWKQWQYTSPNCRYILPHSTEPFHRRRSYLKYSLTNTLQFNSRVCKLLFALVSQFQVPSGPIITFLFFANTGHSLTEWPFPIHNF